MKIIKLTDGNYLRTMENSIRNGTPVLVEDIAWTLDPGARAHTAEGCVCAEWTLADPFGRHGR